MPNLNKLLGKEKKEMTDEQMFKMVQALNKAFGGEDRRCKYGNEKPIS